MPAAPHDYELLDFGDGRKLERFGEHIVDRPCPSAAGAVRRHPRQWRNASLRFADDNGPAGWVSRHVDEQGLQSWRYRQRSPFALELFLEPHASGQVGVFPEQTENWSWMHERVAAAGRPLRVLNLFAYTGASTIAAAAAGAEVTHVDAAKGIVARASENARLSGLADAPIRWIVDDALKYCRREARRGSRYDAVILDPPSYGHGARGEAWQLKRDLPKLLDLCAELTDRGPAWLLLTCHTTGVEQDDLANYMADAGFGGGSLNVEHGEMRLRTRDGRELAAGVFARCGRD